jgi:DNA-binding transcriptional LysR family regulator
VGSCNLYPDPAAAYQFGHTFARDVLTPDDFAAHRFLSWSNLASRKIIHADGRTASLDPAKMICRTILDDGTSQRLATLAGMGISINSLWSVAQDIEAGRLVHVLPDWRSHDRSVLWLIYPKSNVLTPKVRCFMDFLIGRLDVAHLTSNTGP